MPRDRFFISGEHAVGARVRLADDDARKIVTVLRARSGDYVQIVDGAGAAFAARLVVDGTTVGAILERPLTPVTTESAARIVIAQAIPKGQKMDLIVEKATELGAAAIVPLRTSRVIGERTGDNKRERWQRIAKSAAAQCGRAVVPRIEPIADWADLCAAFGAFDRVYVAWEGADAVPLRERFEAEAGGLSSLLIAVGPEGGFSSAEIGAAEAAGAVLLSLGSRILRTETAALALLVALLYARGEM